MRAVALTFVVALAATRASAQEQVSRVTLACARPATWKAPAPANPAAADAPQRISIAIYPEEQVGGTTHTPLRTWEADASGVQDDGRSLSVELPSWMLHGAPLPNSEETGPFRVGMAFIGHYGMSAYSLAPAIVQYLHSGRWEIRPTSSGTTSTASTMSGSGLIPRLRGTNPVVGHAVPRTSLSTSTGGQFTVESIVTGLGRVSHLAVAPDGRVFIAQEDGRILIARGTALAREAAIEIPDIGPGRGGVLGIALHPGFRTNHFVYLAYTAPAETGDLLTRIVRYREVENLLGEAAVIAEISPGDPSGAGALAFGPDGMLYVATGKTTSPDLASAPETLAGKLLRFTDDGTTPPDSALRGPVLADGFLAPTALAWQPGTGRLWVVDRGDGTRVGVSTVSLAHSPGVDGSLVTRALVASVPIPVVTEVGGAAFAPDGPTRSHSLFLAAPSSETLLLLHYRDDTGDSAVSMERLFEQEYGPIHDVVSAPDGSMYFSAGTGPSTSGGAAAGVFRLVPVRR